eukprot:7374304-Alexandrium_andersonii.AAC.1
MSVLGGGGGGGTTAASPSGRAGPGEAGAELQGLGDLEDGEAELARDLLRDGVDDGEPLGREEAAALG